MSFIVLLAWNEAKNLPQPRLTAVEEMLAPPKKMGTHGFCGTMALHSESINKMKLQNPDLLILNTLMRKLPIIKIG